MAYKRRRCVPFDDREWDRIWWPRCARAAKRILSMMSYHEAVRFLEDTVDSFERDDLSYTMETVARRASEWLHGQVKIQTKEAAPGIYRRVFGDWTPRKI